MQATNWQRLTETERRAAAKNAVAQLIHLNRLVTQFRQHVERGSPDVLQGILERQVAQVNIIRALVPTNPPRKLQSFLLEWLTENDQDLLRETMAGINKLDAENKTLLSTRADRISGDLARLRKGNRFRAANRRIA